MLTIFSDIFTKDVKEFQESIIRELEYLSELEDKQTGIEYFETMMRYVFNARADLTEKDVDKLISKIENNFPEGSEVVMTLAERFVEKGMEKSEANALAYAKGAVDIPVYYNGVAVNMTEDKMECQDDESTIIDLHKAAAALSFK